MCSVCILTMMVAVTSFRRERRLAGGEVAADVEGERREGTVGKSAECGADAAQKTRDI